jgi:hypothetical protein
MEIHRLKVPENWYGPCPYCACSKAMLKISIRDTPSQRRLLVKGKPIAPWAAELRSVWRPATADLHGRQLIIDLRSLTEFSEDGEVGPAPTDESRSQISLFGRAHETRYETACRRDTRESQRRMRP